MKSNLKKIGARTARRDGNRSPVVEPLEARIAPATFLVSNTNDSGAGSLRQAILDANTTPNDGGADIISFASIPATGSFVIAPQSPLPDITEALIIDGYTAPGSQPNSADIGTNAVLRVELSGAALPDPGAGSGLILGGSGGSTVRGLAIYDFHFGVNDSGNGILIKSSGNVVAGNFLGTDPSGLSENGNSNSGVAVGSFFTETTATGNLIGGSAPEDRNLISGNTIGISVQRALGTVIRGNLVGTDPTGLLALPNGTGLRITGMNTTIGGAEHGMGNVISGNSGVGVGVGSNFNTTILGNFIGVTADGTAALPNLGAGIRLDNNAVNITIGGVQPGEGNVISGNGGAGIEIGSRFGDGTADSVIVRGNRIGTDLTGILPIGNGGAGIAVYGSSGSEVGNSELGPEAANVIAFNGGAGIALSNAFGNTHVRISANSIHDNAGLGIDLIGGDADYFGVNVNDDLDGDDGPNGLLNQPSIGFTENTGSNVTVETFVQAVPGRTYTVELFALSRGQVDLSGSGEGAVFLGSLSTDTDSSGQGFVAFDLPVSLPADTAFTAVLIDASTGDTSEFSEAAGFEANTYTWTGAVSTDWFNPLNWSPNGIPGPFDTAIQDSDTNPLVLDGLASVASFQHGISVSSPQFSGTGTLIVRQDFQWNGGTHDGPNLVLLGNTSIGLFGTQPIWRSGNLELVGSATLGASGLEFDSGNFQIDGNASLVLNAGVVDLDGVATPSSLINSGVITKLGEGSFGLQLTDVQSNGLIEAREGQLRLRGFELTGGELSLLGGSVTSAGPLLLSDGFVTGSGVITGSVNNQSGYLSPGFEGSPGTITITGNYTQGASGSLLVDIGDISPGSYDRVQVGGGATLDGVLHAQIAPGFAPALGDAFALVSSDGLSGTFQFVIGAGALTPTYSSTSASLVRTGTSFTWTGSVSSDWFTPQNWAPNGVPGVNDVAILDAASGIIDLNGASPTVGDFIQKDGMLTGSADLITLGSFQWSGGAQAGTGKTIGDSGSSLIISGTATKVLDSRTIKIFGTGSWSGTGDTVFSGGALLEDTSLLVISEDIGLQAAAGGGFVQIDGEASLIKTSPGTLIFPDGVILDNGGTLDVESGGVTVLGFGQSPDGFFKIASGANLTFNASTQFNLSGSVLFDGGGTVSLIGGRLSAAEATVEFRPGITFDFSSGFFSAPDGTVTVDGQMNWNGGTMDGGGLLSIQDRLDIRGAGTKSIEGWTVRFEENSLGLLAGPGDLTMDFGARLEVKGELAFDGAVSILNGGEAGTLEVFSTGTLSKGGGGLTDIGLSVSNSGSASVAFGTLQFSHGFSQFDGELYTSFLGTIASPSPLEVFGGFINGNGTIDASLINYAGTVSPIDSEGGLGALTITGDYTQASDAALEIAIRSTNPGSGYGALHVEGTATIDGRLSAFLDDFTPTGSDQFDVLTASAVTGTFSTLDLPSGLAAQYAPDHVSLLALSAQTFTWTGAVSSDWENPENWDLHAVPGAADTAILNSDTVPFQPMITSDEVVGSFVQSAGNLGGKAVLTILTNFTWSGGTESGTGGTIVDSAGVFDLAGGAGKTLDTRFLMLSGASTVTGTGTLSLLGDAEIVNAGTFDIQTDADFLAGAGGGHFNNDIGGTLIKSAGTDATQFGIGVAFNNTGVVDVETGIFELLGGGSNLPDGSFATWTVAPGGMLQFSNGTHTYSNNSVFTGGGLIRLTGGTLSLDGGTLSGLGTTFHVESGTLSIGSLFHANEGTLFEQAGGVVDGSGTLRIDSTFNWSGGMQTGDGLTQIISKGGLNLSGATKTLSTRTMTLSGSGAFTGGNLQLDDGAVFNLEGLLDIQGDGNFTHSAGAAGLFTITGEGTLVKSGGVQTDFKPGVELDVNSSVEVQSGTISVDGGGSMSTGFIILGEAATFQLNSDFNFSGNVHISGDGELVISGGTTRFLEGSQISTDTTGRVSLQGGALNVQTIASLDNQFQWTGGTLFGSGILIVNHAATIEGSGTKALESLALVFNGPVVDSSISDIELDGSALISVNDLYEVRTGHDFVAGPDGGTFLIESGGSLSTELSPATVVFASGVSLDNSGTVTASSGSISIEGGGSGLGGVFNALVGQAIIFKGGTYEDNDTITLQGTGGGEIQLTGGVVLDLRGFDIQSHAFVRVIDGTLELTGSASIAENATLRLEQPATAALVSVPDGEGNAGDLSVSGTLDVAAGKIIGFGSMTIENTGVFNANAVSVEWSVSNFGTINARAITLLNGAPITNSGTLNLIGNTTFLGEGEISNEAIGFIGKDGAGTASFGVDISFTSAGIADFSQGDLVVVEEVTVTGGILTPGVNTTGDFTLEGGVFRGADLIGDIIITGSVTNDGGIFDINQAKGNFVIDGDYTQGPDGTLRFQAFGVAAGDADLLVVSGTTTLDGTLEIDFGGEYVPVIGDSFRVIAGANNPGTFATLTGDILGITQTADATGLTIARGAITYIWDGGGGPDTSWFNPLNWNFDAGVPGAGDTAILNTPATITLSAPATVAVFQQSDGLLSGAGSLSVESSLTWNGGVLSSTLNLPATATGTIGGSALKDLEGATLNVGGLLTWTGTGNFAINNASLNIQTGGVFDIQTAASILDPDGSATVGQIFVNGTLRKSGGSGTASIGGSLSDGFVATTVGATGHIENQNGTLEFAGPFTTAGTVESITGNLNFTSNFTQTSGATILSGGSIGGGITLVYQGGELRGAGAITGTVDNQGAIIRPGGTSAAGSISISGNYSQSAGGHLAVELGGTGAGQFDVLNIAGTAALGGTLDVVTLGAFSVVTGQSFRVVQSSGNPGSFTTLNGAPPGLVQAPDATGLVLSAVPLVYIWDAGGGADTSWFNPLNWNFDSGVPGATDTAILSTSATITLPANVSVGSFNQSNGILTSAAGITLTINTSFMWSGGTQAGGGITQIAAGGSAALNGEDGVVIDGRTIANAGTLTWSGTGDIHLNSGAINNQAGAMFLIQSGESLDDLDGAATIGSFMNAGTVRKSGPPGTTTIQLSGLFSNTGAFNAFSGSTQIGSAFDNSGTVSVQGGSLTLNGTGTHTGSFQALDSAAITLGGTQTLNSSSTSLLGTPGGSIFITQTTNWLGGDIAGVTVTSSGTLHVATGGSHNVFGPLTNNGTMTVQAPVTVINGAQISNAGLIDIQADVTFMRTGGPAIIDNLVSGIVRKSGGTGIAQMLGTGGAIANAGSIEVLSGTLQLQGGIVSSSGTISLGGGSLAGDFNLTGGELRGTGTITGSINNTGATIKPGGTGAAGTISIVGNYTQAASATLAVELGGTGAGQFDVLSVSGTTTLGGTLDITKLGAFATAPGQSFRVVQSSGTPGTFAALTGTTLGISQAADATGLALTVNPLVYIWDGGGDADTSWFNPLNWNFDSGVPGALDTAVLNTAAIISLPSNTSVGSFQQSTGTFTSPTGVTLTILTNFDWSGGSQAGSGTTQLAAGSTATLGGAGSRSIDGHTLANAGTLTWSGTGDIHLNSGTIDNQAGGFFLIQNGQALDDTDGPTTVGAFINAGTLRKTTDTGTSLLQISGLFANTGALEVQSGTVSISTAFNNSGTVSADSGNFTLGGAGTHTGSFQAINNGVISLGGTQTFSGAGTSLLSALGGSIVLAQSANWTSGIFSGVTVAPSAVLNVNGDVGIAGPFVNNGTVNVSGDIAVTNGAQITNAGLFDFKADIDVIRTGGPATIDNLVSGIVRKSGGTGTTQLLGTGGGIVNAGTLEVLTGTLGFAGGTVSSSGNVVLGGGTFHGDFSLTGGELRGSGLIEGNVDNSGATVRPGGTGAAGTISITGAYTQSSGGTLAVELGGVSAGQFDVLAVGGIATFGGTVDSTLIGGFVPGPNLNFPVLTYSSQTGTFTSVHLPTSFTTSTQAGAFVLFSFIPPDPLVVNTVLDIVDPMDPFTSLREAILFANGNAGLDTITFNIPGSGVQTLSPTSALPVITDAVVIDGYSQPGTSANTLPNGSNAVLLIALDGTIAGSADGLVISGGGSTIQGLIIEHFGGNGIVLQSAGGNTIAGNLIGTDAAGASGHGNSLAGVLISSGSGNIIGGTTAAARNVIAFNADGVEVSDGARGHLILGNLIHSNTGLAIDLNGDGVTPNDAGDADSGANDLLNAPALNAIIASGNGANVTGMLDVAVSGPVRIEFFLSQPGGLVPIGSTNVAATAGTATPFTFALPGPLSIGDAIVATASDLSTGGSGTSEFSPVTLVAPTAIHIGNAVVVEGDIGTVQATFTLTLIQAVSTPVTVHFSTGDFRLGGGNATAGADYVAISDGIATFAANQLTQTITITVNADSLAEARERFLVTLSNPTNAGLLDTQATGIIQDDDHNHIAVGSANGSTFTVHELTASGETLVSTVQAFDRFYGGGVRVAVGDVTGDGVDDFIAGAGLGGRGVVRVFDGSTLEPVKGSLGQFNAFASVYRGGVHVAAGDVNGDGHADIIVVPSAGSSSTVRVFSGADGSLLNSFQAFGKGTAGLRVAAGDINGDGIDEVIVGTGTGSNVRVFDAMAGSLLAGDGHNFRALPKAYKGGIYVSAADMNNDGLDDIIVGAAAGNPQIKIFPQGDAGNPQTFKAYKGALRGVRIATLDVDGDGIAEIIASKGPRSNGKITVIEGDSLDKLFDFSPFGKARDGLFVG